MKLPKSDEDLEDWAKDYPDVAAIVETIAMKKQRNNRLLLKSVRKRLMKCKYLLVKKKQKLN